MCLNYNYTSLGKKDHRIFRKEVRDTLLSHDHLMIGLEIYRSNLNGVTV